MKGLGRGHGFEVVSVTSALDNPEVIDLIKDRLLDLLDLFLSEGIVSAEEISERLGVDQNVQEQSDSGLTGANQKLMQCGDAVENLINKVSPAIDEDPATWSYPDDQYYGEEESDVNARLELLTNGLERLISEYVAIRASEEE